jgi:hypothetical protein
MLISQNIVGMFFNMLAIEIPKGGLTSDNFMRMLGISLDAMKTKISSLKNW